jgi:hypothetical protein
MTVALKGGRGHRWCADEGNVRCNRRHIRGWERFKVVAARDTCGADVGTFALRGGRGRRYCADEGHRFMCNRNRIGKWEKFTEIKLGGRRSALRGGRYNRLCADEGNRIRCNRNRIGGWERFHIRCVGNCHREELGESSGETDNDAQQLEDAPENDEDKSDKKGEDTPPYNFQNSNHPVPWNRYGTSFKWLWPKCPGGDCKKSKPHKIAKSSAECNAEFYYGIQACGKFPSAAVTWKSPIDGKLDTSDIGCNCRGELVKAAFYGTIVSTRDLTEATQATCAASFAKWTQEVRGTLASWETALQALSQEATKMCSPTAPVFAKEKAYRLEVKKLEGEFKDKQDAIKAVPAMIQPGFDWMKRPKKVQMPANFMDNNGECKADYYYGLSVCKTGKQHTIGSRSFGCGCAGLYMQGANFGVVTGMKDQSEKTQAKCARLFAAWSAEQAVLARGSFDIAYDIAPAIALKCSAARQLAEKAAKHRSLSGVVEKLTPLKSANAAQLKILQASHNKLHEKHKAKLAREASEKALERKFKTQGAEKQTKHLERTDKEVKNKHLHSAWQDANDADELKNKAQERFNENEAKRLDDLKARSDAMQQQLADKSNSNWDSGLANAALESRKNRGKIEVSELTEKVHAATEAKSAAAAAEKGESPL